MERKKKNTKKVNILLVEIINRNLGDTVIGDTALRLIQKAIPFFGKDRFVVHPYNVYSEDYDLIAMADLIVFDGGGIIKYKREEFYLYIARLLERANAADIPVYFNGVGVEGYDAEDEKCQMLKQALNLPCVKGISIRDDLDTLLQHYMEREDIMTCQVADPAVFTPQVFGYKKDDASRTIGLGIVRYRIFEDHDMPEITKEFQLQMWSEIAQKLEARGYHWKLFVNGLKSDFEFAQEVLEYMGKTEEAGRYLVPRPTESWELVHTIASFQGIIACRMHANIIAYSMKVPSIGLVWNDKLTFWGERIGYPERFLTTDDFQADRIVDVMDQSVQQGVKKRGKSFDNSVYHPLKKFVREYGKTAKKKNDQIELGKEDWRKVLVSTALGGKCLQYRNMNTLDTLVQSYHNGFRKFEADIRMTCDGRLVCVNGWSKQTWQKLGLDPEDCRPLGMTYDEFMQSRYYDGHYPVMSFTELLEQIREYEGWSLILDFGKPDRETMPKILGKLERQLGTEPELLKKLTIRLQTRYDVELFSASDVAFPMMFYIPPKAQRDKYEITVESVARFCKRKGIRWVSLSKEAFDEEVAPLLKESRLKVCVFSYNTLTDIQDALRRGADMVGTHFMTVNGLNDITGKHYLP